VVDDAPEIRQIHARLLHGSGMEIMTAENGTLALDTARRTSPDVVVTDLDMPVMDGLALCRQLRADAATRHVGVVVVTGDASVQAQAAIDAGCDAVLGKPCSRTLLLAMIRRLLERH
jgi:two-component system response regulator MprA